jgi:MoaA/NifB/PqqE/SkfB family radical SAM enzyme|tara:strand:- start:215 stop:1195 length:981 start_codon:yes stop_codon:yes gene_type:complete
MKTEKKWQEAYLYPPDRLAVHVTNICNANCTFCAYQYLTDKKALLKEEHFIKTIDQYQDMGGSFVDFTPLVGDLLVDPKIFDKLNYVTNKEYFKTVRFYTNGILLGKKDYPKRLLEARPTNVTFSVPGFEEGLYQRVYRTKTYKRMLKGVHEFVRINKESGSPIKVNFSVKPDSPAEESVYTEDYKKFIEPYIDEDSIIFVTDLDNWGGSIKQEDLTGNMKLAPAIPIGKKNKPCYYTFFLALMVDGHIRLCGCRYNNGTEYDELVVGHVDDNSLLEIWQSDKAQETRANFLKGKLASVCQTCSHYAPYSGKERAEKTIINYMSRS